VVVNVRIPDILRPFAARWRHGATATIRFAENDPTRKRNERPCQSLKQMPLSAPAVT
jgi:hypothetical protein